ncbi:Hpt domain-containing protein [Acaryochloris sp. IP29b_bin.148]|uniref:Hpt domain-containing protein n=1 Tax=Acaryochloris sp. IP29b_bin.148 TaxID=2969218 RepID=UPI00262B0043|nr:Hpt domain-containing protein [Acaryochloris sp. IP29b_bin.148]
MGEAAAVNGEPLGPEPQVIDPNQLQEYSDGDRAFEQELLELFVEDTHRHLVQLRHAIATQAFEAARQEAHHIKGASAHVGAIAMSKLAATLETHAKQQTAPAPLLGQLEQAYQQVMQQAEQWGQD